MDGDMALLLSKDKWCEHNHAPLNIKENRKPRVVPCDQGWKCQGNLHCVNGIYVPLEQEIEAKRSLSPAHYHEMLGLFMNIGRMAVKPNGALNEKALQNTANCTNEWKVVIHCKWAFSITTKLVGAVFAKNNTGSKLAITKLLVANQRILRSFHDEISSDLLLFPGALGV